MNAGTFARLQRAAVAAVLLACGHGAALSAHQDLPAFGEGGHVHDPIDVDLRPIVSRVRTPFVRPRRLLLEPAGDLIVADWGAGAVVRIDPDGNATLLAEDLHEPAGLARDSAGNLYVATHADGMTGAGTVSCISTAGEPSLYAAGLTGPTGLAFDPHGDLYVAQFHENSIVRIAPDGEPEMFVDDLPGPAALAFDSAGTLYVASSTQGTLIRVSPMGEATVVSRGFAAPSDLAFDPRGHLIVANSGGTELSWVDNHGMARAFAIVPRGTIAIEFDPDGNLLFANWDYQSVMKVTSYLAVPCPHCRKPIPIRLRPRERDEPDKPLGPII